MKSLTLNPSEDYKTLRKLNDNRLWQAVRRTAKCKKGRLHISINSLEKWNYDTWDSDGTLIEPLPGHPYDVEGHSSCDVYALHGPHFTQFGDYWRILKSLYKWAIETWEFGKIYYNPFSPWVSWVWVIDSLETEKSGMAEEIADRECPYEPDPAKEGEFRVVSLSEREINSLRKHNEYRQKIEDRLTLEDVRAHLEITHTKINDFLWLSKEDPTCFTIDETIVPFDLKDGWSNATIAKLIGYWTKSVGDEFLVVNTTLTT